MLKINNDKKLKSNYNNQKSPLQPEVVDDDDSSVVTPNGIYGKSLEESILNKVHKNLNEYWTKDMDNAISKIKYLYHAVFNEKSYEYVKRNGIKRDSQGWIYLSTKPIIKNNNNPWSVNNTVAVFKVRIPDKSKLYDWREIWMDDDGNETDSDHQYDKNNPYYMYSGDIPKQYIEEVSL